MKNQKFEYESVSAHVEKSTCGETGVVNFGSWISRGSAIAALMACVTVANNESAQGAVIGGVNLGGLTDNLFFFSNGSVDANWQGASKGFVGNVSVNGTAAFRTSGTVPYAGTVYTDGPSLGAWQNIVNANPGQASASLNQVARINGLSTSLTGAFAQANALPASQGFSSVLSTSLNGLNTQNGIAETFVINVTSGFTVSSQINITGDASDAYILRWDTDANSGNGYQGQAKFQSGGAIVPLGGLSAANFINLAGDIGSSGGGSNPTANGYPQGPRLNQGAGSLINGGADWNGGGFFTGYWLTTGDPTTGDTSPLSNAIFVGGWYSTTDKFSMTSGTSGINIVPVPEPQAVTLLLGGLGLLGYRRVRQKSQA
jgi:hypothetical protein